MILKNIISPFHDNQIDDNHTELCILYLRVSEMTAKKDGRNTSMRALGTHVTYWNNRPDIFPYEKVSRNCPIGENSW